MMFIRREVLIIINSEGMQGLIIYRDGIMKRFDPQTSDLSNVFFAICIQSLCCNSSIEHLPLQSFHYPS